MAKQPASKAAAITWEEGYTVTRKGQNNNPVRLKKLFEIVNPEGLKLRFLNGLYTLWINKRLRWGMFLLLVVAPFSKFFYLLLPVDGFGEYLVNIGPIRIGNIEGHSGWYFVSFRQYFWSIGELMAPVISFMGVFFLFPRRYYPAYLIGVPFGYYLSMLIHRMFFVTNNDNFHNGFTSAITFAFVIFGIILFVVSDKFLAWDSRQKRAVEARVIGLVSMPGLSWEQKEPIIRQEVDKVLKTENELFDKKSA